ncbi:TIGR03862 family flavoprotein [Devosia sp. XJ19-1]|uniref:TIGR03862 family flavoprotein n=1 Tax=Devosia ureilytica TaxID=2952754 RepID=A0A9Q4AR84_9HYPH|nr:TIGR03862 family flavoprotein [Devosia ureilytica]MCP8884566.1 TIGR03862 family flavoprotein [Devosia ureilytica]MCP8888196.1 TIGR03862 family flavoprotein [Devosia ureilytica]
MGRIAIIGGGPAGLMAAEAAAAAGADVVVFDAMPTVGRKLLMAGKSGLNITHAEDKAQFEARYGASRAPLQAALDDFPASALRDWCAGLGIETFVGSSGRVFPKAMKASPLLRAWLGRLAGQGVTVKVRHRWLGYDGDMLVFETPEGQVTDRFDAVVLALGGASWPALGSDAAWVPRLAERGVSVAPFRPANCGFEVNWSPVFAERFAGAPVKAVVARSDAGDLPGEFVVSRSGIEGSLVYAHAAALRDRLERDGVATLTLDLAPGRSVERLAKDLGRQPAKASFSNRLRKGAGLDGVKLGLLRELVPDAASRTAETLAGLIKALPLPVERPGPIEQAISVAGGIAWDGLDAGLMLRALPGTFACGEMLDWEAPTGGYLLTACLATGRLAGQAAAQYARERT